MLLVLLVVPPVILLRLPTPSLVDRLNVQQATLSLLTPPAILVLPIVLNVLMTQQIHGVFVALENVNNTTHKSQI